MALRDEAEARALESEAQRVARLKHDADVEAAALVNEEAIRRDVYARDVATRARKGLRRGDAVVKRAEPCKWVVGQFAGDECWAHEYTDPKTGNRVIKHTCDRLHPGEVGWHTEWLANPRWRAAPAAHLFRMWLRARGTARLREHLRPARTRRQEAPYGCRRRSSTEQWWDWRCQGPSAARQSIGAGFDVAPRHTLLAARTQVLRLLFAKINQSAAAQPLPVREEPLAGAYADVVRAGLT
jgi:hypothetical protein